jgi:hypothetical protein
LATLLMALVVPLTARSMPMLMVKPASRTAPAGGGPACWARATAAARSICRIQHRELHVWSMVQQQQIPPEKSTTARTQTRTPIVAAIVADFLCRKVSSEKQRGKQATLKAREVHTLSASRRRVRAGAVADLKRKDSSPFVPQNTRALGSVRAPYTRLVGCCCCSSCRHSRPRSSSSCRSWTHQQAQGGSWVPREQQLPGAGQAGW